MSVKDLRDKPLSDMSYDELTAYIKKAKDSGYSISESKDLGKAEDLRKVLMPDNYGSETVASAKNKLLNSTTPETQANLGIGGATSGNKFDSLYGGSGAGGVGSIDLNKIYEDAMNSPKMKALEDDLLAKKTALTEALTGINDNPFYSEATRTGKVAKLNEQAGREISDIEYQLNLAKADAQTKVNIATQQYNIDSQAYQNELSKLNMLINSGALLNASSDDIAKIGIATGMSTEMIIGIQEKMKQDQVAPQVITSTDNAGNVTVAVVDGNTGNIISQNSLGSVGQSKTSGSGGSGDYSSSDITKHLTKATAILKDVDTMNYGDPDHLLSSWEADEAYNRILSLVNGDTNLADLVFQQAISVGGYKPWGQ